MAFAVISGPNYVSTIFVGGPVAVPSRRFAPFSELIGFSWAPSGTELAISYRTGSYQAGSPAGFPGPGGGRPRRRQAGPERSLTARRRLLRAGELVAQRQGPGHVVGSSRVGQHRRRWPLPGSSDLATGKLKTMATTLVHNDWLAWSPSGRSLALVAGGNRVLWDSGKRVEVCAIPTASCVAVRLPRGQFMTVYPSSLRVVSSCSMSPRATAPPVPATRPAWLRPQAGPSAPTMWPVGTALSGFSGRGR